MPVAAFAQLRRTLEWASGLGRRLWRLIGGSLHSVIGDCVGGKAGLIYAFAYVIRPSLKHFSALDSSSIIVSASSSLLFMLTYRIFVLALRQIGFPLSALMWGSLTKTATHFGKRAYLKSTEFEKGTLSRIT